MSKEERKAKKAEKKAAKKAEKERLLRLKMTPKAMIVYALLQTLIFAYLNENFISKSDFRKVKERIKKNKEAN